MQRSKVGLTGKVTVTVYGPDGNVKRRSPNRLQRLLGLQGSPMVSINHNIVTNHGDALVADALAETPARQKVSNANGRMTVGTGWTGTTPKNNVACNTATGSAEALDATYPKLKTAWGGANDNVVQYQATWEAGDLNASGIDEVALHNTTVDNLAYAQITPAVDVTAADTLTVLWEITALGA